MLFWSISVHHITLLFPRFCFDTEVLAKQRVIHGEHVGLHFHYVIHHAQLRTTDSGETDFSPILLGLNPGYWAYSDLLHYNVLYSSSVFADVKPPRPLAYNVVGNAPRSPWYPGNLGWAAPT